MSFPRSGSLRKEVCQFCFRSIREPRCWLSPTWLRSLALIDFDGSIWTADASQMPEQHALITVLILASSANKVAQWQIGSSDLVDLNHGALRFSSGGDARASPLCLPQVTPVQLRAATPSLNHAAG